MNKEKFDTMTLNEQLDYINNRLLSESMRAISADIGIHKNTIPSLFTKNGYIFDKETKQYIKSEILDNSQANESVNKPVLVNSQDKKPIFDIPIKIKNKTTTKAFNVVMKEELVYNIDELAKIKGYSRNELINYMCNFFIENMKGDK